MTKNEMLEKVAKLCHTLPVEECMKDTCPLAWLNDGKCPLEDEKNLDEEIESKKLKYAWHNLHKNPNDLPQIHEQVIVNVKGTDIIFPKPNESWKDAIERCQKEATAYSTLACLDEEGYWESEMGPMIVQPRAWKRIEELKDEDFEDE